MKFETAAIISAIIGFLVLLVAASFLFAWPVMALWNGCLVDAVTWAKPIGWLQAWGLVVLSGFLVKPSVSTSSK